jgi:hydrogenase expression/formation protein HypC
MCLAIPGKIVEIYHEQGLRMGKLDFGGTIRKCCLEYVQEANVGDYALVHVGFAISTMDEEEALRTYQFWQDMEDFLVERDKADPETSWSPGEP